MHKTILSLGVAVMIALSLCLALKVNMSKMCHYLSNVEALAEHVEDNTNISNMASICVASDFFCQPCTVSGELTIGVVTIKGSYSQGKSYPIPWARYQCQQSQGNTCTKQGLYTGDTKLA